MRSNAHLTLVKLASRICTETSGYAGSASPLGCSACNQVYSQCYIVGKNTAAALDWIGLSQKRQSSSLDSSQGSIGPSSTHPNVSSSGSRYEQQPEPSQQDPGSSAGRDNAYRRGFGAKVALPAKDVLQEVLVDQAAIFKLRAYHLGQRIHIGRVQHRASSQGCRTNSGKDYCIIWLTPKMIVQSIRRGQSPTGANAAAAKALKALPRGSKKVQRQLKLPEALSATLGLSPSATHDELQPSRQDMLLNPASRQEEGIRDEINPLTYASGAVVVPPTLVVYRYGSVVFTGTSGDLEASLVDLLVPRQLRYKAGGQSDAWMMQAPMMTGTWLPQEEQTVVVKPGAAHPAVKGVDKIELRLLDVGSVRVLTSVLGQSAALKFYETSVGDAVDKLMQWRARKRRAAGHKRGWSLGVFGTSQEQSTMFKVFAASALITNEASELLEMAEPAWQYDAYHSIWSLAADDFELEKRFKALETKLQQVEKEAKHDVKQREGWKYQRLEQFVILLLVVSCMIAFLELSRELLSNSTSADQQGIALYDDAAGLSVDVDTLADPAANAGRHLQQQEEEAPVAATAGLADGDVASEHASDGPGDSVLVSVDSNVGGNGAVWVGNESSTSEASSVGGDTQCSSNGSSQKARSRLWPWRRGTDGSGGQQGTASAANDYR